MVRLREKFGPPTTFEVVPMQNAYGVKVSKYKAVWDNSQVYVDFDGITDKVDEGWVSIKSAVARTKFLK